MRSIHPISQCSYTFLTSMAVLKELQWMLLGKKQKLEKRVSLSHCFFISSFFNFSICQFVNLSICHFVKSQGIVFSQDFGLTHDLNIVLVFFRCRDFICDMKSGSNSLGVSDKRGTMKTYARSGICFSLALNNICYYLEHSMKIQ